MLHREKVLPVRTGDASRRWIDSAVPHGTFGPLGRPCELWVIWREGKLDEPTRLRFSFNLDYSRAACSGQEEVRGEYSY